MSLSITEFPQDILLELAKRLDVADLLSLLSLCRITRRLQLERTLWLDALIRIRQVEMQPFPLSTADSVDTLSLSELQNAVRRADRLIKIFKSEKPRPFHIGNFSVESLASIFFIPGANLIVAHTSKGNVSCWDTLTSQRVATRVAHLNNERARFYADHMPHYSLPQMPSYKLSQISLVGAEPSVSSSPASNIPRIPSDHPGPNTTQLSASNAPEVRAFVPDFSGKIHPPRVFTPHYGIFAVTSLAGTIRRADSDIKLNLIHFWPGHADRDSDNIEFRPGCFYQHPDHISDVTVGASGTHVLLLVKQQPEEPYLEPYLGLVHFIPLPVPHTTFRKLDTGDVKLSSCKQIGLDDSLGLIAIMDEERQVTTISYV
ncbi:hypothetical protein B0H13DRAFT_2538098 [Mycena leptocephala]|nr:hypothetical protein B0H13DRAFT_2538098 [Mycena leptocephala]